MGVLSTLARRRLNMDFVKIDTVQLSGNNRKSDYFVKPVYARYTGDGDTVDDIIVRGGELVAYWNGERWISALTKLKAAIDKMTRAESRELQSKHPDNNIASASLQYDGGISEKDFDTYLQKVTTNNPAFDTKVLFKDANPKREDYSTYQLPYSPKEGDTTSFDKMLTTLYEESEYNKVLWFMGAALSGSMHKIQKFMYLYGGKGTGKGTVIKIFELLFKDYADTISLSLLTGGTPFAAAQVKDVPLLIDSEADINRMKQDTNLLQLTAHEPLYVNPKYGKPYDITFEGLLVAASNQAFKVRNADSGITRRAVTIRPSNQLIERNEYNQLMAGVKAEIPAIAHKAISYFRSEGANRYENEVDVDIMKETDVVFSFVSDYYQVLGDRVSLNVASTHFKAYLEDLGWSTEGSKARIKQELKRYYNRYDERLQVDGVRQRHVYSDLKMDLLFPDGTPPEIARIKFDSEGESIFDVEAADYQAQYTTDDGYPQKKWDNVKTTLKDLDTGTLHYVMVPQNHIVLDFDLKNASGEKDLELNLERAAEFPETYAELSKSGKAVHLHYIYDGDVGQLAREIEPNVEIKVFSGKMTLRRKLTKFSNKPIAHISSGLPFKEEKDMKQDNGDLIYTENKMRKMIKKNLRKEYHKATKPSVDYIADIFAEAQAQDLAYDLSDLKGDVIAFAAQSSHRSDECLKTVADITWVTKELEDTNQVMLDTAPTLKKARYDKEELLIVDIEVYSNLLVVVWKKYGKDNPKTVWFNPTAEQVSWLTDQPYIGFNNRNYDNQILYMAMEGANNMELFDRSQQLIVDRARPNYAASEMSYADVYEFSSKKQSLKKWEIQLGIRHDEFEFPWDKPLDKSNWDRAGEYCGHDVDATEILFDHLEGDFKAREILADLSGLPTNARTQAHAEKFIFGDDKRPQDKFVVEDLSKMFPGYTYSFNNIKQLDAERTKKAQAKADDKQRKVDGTNAAPVEPIYMSAGMSRYKDIDPSEGGYVYAKPGVYKHVVEMDVESMHPNSLINLNYFGPYTPRFKELVQARLLIKHGDYEGAGKLPLLGETIKPYLGDKSEAKALAQAMKIVINIIYGMTSAKFDNKFRASAGNGNEQNVVAKRGALFMIDAQKYAESIGAEVVHIKTDSIKLANVDDSQINLMVEFAKNYGYNFAVEQIFDKFALVNKSTLIGHIEDNPEWEDADEWHPIGAQFLDPFTLKTLFTHEDLVSEDFTHLKSVKGGAIYIGETFVGKNAQIYCSQTGYDVTRREDLEDGTQKISSVAGTKGFKWRLWSDYKGVEDLNMAYYEEVAKLAVKKIDMVSSDIEAKEYMLEDIPENYKQLIMPF